MEEMLEDFPISEPALEYVEASVQPKAEMSRLRKRTDPDAQKDSEKGKILTVMMLGAFVAILNQTLLNVAIPHIMNDLGVSANTVQWLSTGGAMILLPIYLQNIRGFTALQSGLLMLPGAIVMGIMSPISGALFDKIGARWLAVFGLAVTVNTTWQFTGLSMTTSYSHILLLYVLRMFGMSFIMMTVMTEGLNQLPRHLAPHGTVASNTARQVAGIGTAFLARSCLQDWECIMEIMGISLPVPIHI